MFGFTGLLYLLPLSLSTFNILQSQSNTYRYACGISYKDSYTLNTQYQANNNAERFIRCDVEYTFTLLFNDRESFRLDFDSVDFSWYYFTNNVQNDGYFDGFEGSLAPDLSYTYDTISDFEFYVEYFYGPDNFGDAYRVVAVYDNNRVEKDVFQSGEQVPIYLPSFDLIFQYDTSDFMNFVYYIIDSSQFYKDGYDDGYYYGQQNGELIGTQNGNAEGYTIGYSDGYEVGVADGSRDAYAEGYTDGYNDGYSTDSTAATIFTGIAEVGLLPVNVFLAIFNFEVFGINIGGFVASLLTVAIIVIIIRVILAKSGGGKN